MTIDEYLRAVIALFKSGDAKPRHYREMAKAVMEASERGEIQHIDSAVGVDYEE